MNDKPLSNTAIVTSIGFLSSCFALAFLAYSGVSYTGLMVPTAAGWLIALIGLRHQVDPKKHTALYVVFGVLAVMIFFLHETYA